MKFARLRVDFHGETLSPLHEALLATDGVERVQLRFGGIAPSGPLTYVCSVTGDAVGLSRALADVPTVLEHELVDETGNQAVMCIRTQPSETGLALRETLSRGTLVMTTPVDMYADGSVVFRVLGSPADLRTAVAELRDVLPVDVEQLTDYDSPPMGVTAALTDRQEAALRAALSLGYYDVPRDVTHEDVAAELDCAPSTASEHLRKAEAALVRSVFRADAGEA